MRLSSTILFCVTAMLIASMYFLERSYEVAPGVEAQQIKNFVILQMLKGPSPTPAPTPPDRT